MRSSPHAEGWNFRAAGGATLPDYVRDLASRTADLAACEAELPPAPRLITDTRTGLMWETKSDDDAIHDKDNFYRWSGLSFGNRECWMERS